MIQNQMSSVEFYRIIPNHMITVISALSNGVLDNKSVSAVFSLNREPAETQSSENHVHSYDIMSVYLCQCWNASYNYNYNYNDNYN